MSHDLNSFDSKDKNAIDDVADKDVIDNSINNKSNDINNKTANSIDNEATSDTNELKEQAQVEAGTISNNISDPALDDSETEANDTDIAVEKKEDKNSKKRTQLYKLLHIMCIAGFVIFAALFINEVIIQPIRIKQSIDLTRDLYKKSNNTKTTSFPSLTPIVSTTPQPLPTGIPATPTPDPNRDEQGRLLQFKDLLAINDDVKGWITIPDTNIDYVVVQSDKDNPELYLDKDINLEYSKAGTLFLDSSSSVRHNSQNLVIHGHNMVSTAEKMFHHLLKYKKPSYYKEHPLITFDTIYRTGQWKIFAVFITNGSSKKEPFFNFTKPYFVNELDFLNFVYQIKIRSVLNIDSVDITDSDQLLMLSTCSYEIDNYRTVIVARRVRDGEDPAVDTDAVKVNKTPLYPESYYYRYGGKAPKLPATFEEAMANGEINWYTPPELINQKSGNQEDALQENSVELDETSILEDNIIPEDSSTQEDISTQENASTLDDASTQDGAPFE